MRRRRSANRQQLDHDSQGLCFLGDVSIEDMLRREIPLAEGNVLSEEGEVIGRHEGAQAYTLGQRHGFTVTKKQTHAPALYVVAKDAARNTITVSASRVPEEKTATEITLEDANWIGEASPGRCEARFRYRGALIPAVLGGNNTVQLTEPHYVPEGQSLVLYQKERCLGGGVISSARLVD